MNVFLFSRRRAPRAFLPALTILAAVGFALAGGPCRAADPSLSVMAGEMIMVGFRGLDLEDDAPVLRALAGGKAGGVILFGSDSSLGPPRNIASPEQVRTLVARLRAAARGPIFVAVDQEGGRVQRLSSRNGFSDWPSARALGLGHDAGATYQSALSMGRALASAGFNLNFAPSVDVHRPDSPAIGALDRAFSTDPRVVTEHARAFARGMNDAGVVCVLKHFPGHGSASGDTHNGVADVTGTWSEGELEPYRALIGEGFDGMIMAAHVILRLPRDREGEIPPAARGASEGREDLPASLSPVLINGLLRRELGWSGVVITDDLQMAAAANGRSLRDIILLAVNAGADILLFGNNLTHDPLLADRVHAALLELVDEGLLSPDRLRESWLRVRELKSRLP